MEAKIKLQKIRQCIKPEYTSALNIFSIKAILNTYYMTDI